MDAHDIITKIQHRIDSLKTCSGTEYEFAVQVLRELHRTILNDLDDELNAMFLDYRDAVDQAHEEKLAKEQPDINDAFGLAKHICYGK